MSKQSDSHLGVRIRIATRGSKLALWQAEHVAALLQKKGCATQIVPVKTRGDVDQKSPLHLIGGKGVFVKEVEKALEEGEADIAVHSLKDMPARLPDGFHLAAVLPRHSSRDLLILREEHRYLFGDKKSLMPSDLEALEARAVGTGSLRRSYFLRQEVPRVSLIPLRGNVDSRLEKLRCGVFDAIVLAEASMERLGLAEDLPSCTFDPHVFVPAPAQGALAVETLEGFSCDALASLNCSQTFQAVGLERDVLAMLGADCRMPIGLHVWEEFGRCHLDLMLLGKGSQKVQFSLEVDPSLGARQEVLERVQRKALDGGVQALLQALGLPPLPAVQKH